MIVLGIFSIVAVWEWSGFLSIDALFGRLAYLFLVTAILVASVWLFPGVLPVAPLMWVGLIWWCCATIWVMRYPTPIGRGIGAVCGVLVILPAWVGLVTLLGTAQRGAEYVLFVLSIVWAADVGAYFVGRRIGRTRLAPRVSPGKTWEGVIGGMIAASIAALLGSSWLGQPPATLLPLALSIAAISIVGDLTVSMFKRNAGLKDSGNLFPGHGGVLDRIDSVTAAVPLFALYATWVGLIPG